MTANINPDTGIAYGYISANRLDGELVDKLMYGDQAVNESAQEAYREYVRDWRAERYRAWEEDYRDERVGREEEPDDDAEPSEREVQAFWDDYHSCECEPEISGEYEGVKYRTSWLGGALNFFILFSPHVTTTARMASPCVPNAAILDTLDGSVTGYNVPNDWRV